MSRFIDLDIAHVNVITSPAWKGILTVPQRCI